MKTIRSSSSSSSSTSPARSHPALAALALAALVLAVLVGAPTAAHAGPTPPQLSIAVDDGSTSAKSGERLAYTVTVTNLGAAKVKDLRVSQTVPAGASVVSADAGAERAKGSIRWSVDLAPAAKVTMHSTLALGPTPDSTLRLATVACAQVSAKGPALVCASDSDQLPAGAAVQPASDDGAAPSGWLDGRAPWFVGGGAGLVVVLLGALLLVRRHRHRLAGPGPVAQRASTVDAR